MKTWVWLALIILTLLVGCAPGCYETGPAYQESSPHFIQIFIQIRRLRNNTREGSGGNRDPKVLSLAGLGCCPGRNSIP